MGICTDIVATVNLGTTLYTLADSGQVKIQFLRYLPISA
jgi:hypothetical protein